PAVFGFSCEAARYRVDGWSSELGTVDPVRPALGRAQGRLFLAFAQGGRLQVRSMAGLLACPDDIVPGCGDWSGPTDGGQPVAGGIAAAALEGVLHAVFPRP